MCHRMCPPHILAKTHYWKVLVSSAPPGIRRGRQVNPNHIVQDFVAVCQQWQEVGTPCHQTPICQSLPNTNTFQNLNKYIWNIRQIPFKINTNTFHNLDKYIVQFISSGRRLGHLVTRLQYAKVFLRSSCKSCEMLDVNLEECFTLYWFQFGMRLRLRYWHWY